MIFQHFNLLSSRTAAENVALPLEVAGYRAPAIRARVEELLALVGLSDKRDRYPSELSGGQKQRVGIARALATNPKVLLSDEATSALDPETTRQILDLLARINRELGLTILLITHEMAVIRSIAHEVAVIDEGRIVEQGDVYDLFTRPTHSVTRSFLADESGRALPAHLAREIRPASVPGGRALVRITFRGPHASDPILARLARDLSIESTILAGAVDEIAGRPFGTLVVGIPEASLASALTFLGHYGLDTEVLGHLA
jgi:D-methionine transport system ATP-binding protein